MKRSWRCSTRRPAQDETHPLASLMAVVGSLSEAMKTSMFPNWLRFIMTRSPRRSRHHDMRISAMTQPTRLNDSRSACRRRAAAHRAGRPALHRAGAGGDEACYGVSAFNNPCEPASPSSIGRLLLVIAIVLALFAAGWLAARGQQRAAGAVGAYGGADVLVTCTVIVLASRSLRWGAQASTSCPARCCCSTPRSLASSSSSDSGISL